MAAWPRRHSRRTGRTRTSAASATVSSTTSSACSSRRKAYASAGPDKTVDWTLEALVPIVERRLPLITTANREQDIRDAVAFADRAKVNIVIAGGAEANYVASLLKEKNIPVILSDRLTMPAREDDFHASSYQLAGELAKAGVKVAFSTGDNTNVQAAALQRGDLGRVGPDPRRGAEGA